jgi:hypothetical protein
MTHGSTNIMLSVKYMQYKSYVVCTRQTCSEQFTPSAVRAEIAQIGDVFGNNNRSVTKVINLRACFVQPFNFRSGKK